MKQHHPDAEVTIYEKSAKVLSKVRISGGGRCNVTNATFDLKELSSHYPRGANFLKKCFGHFDPKETMEWFEKRGVEMKVYPDKHVFPLSNSSETIINCFTSEAKKLGIKVLTSTPISAAIPNENGFELQGREECFQVDKVIVTIGGQPKRSGLEWMEELSHTIIETCSFFVHFQHAHEPDY